MAICGRCERQTESAGEVCILCSEYAAATSRVGAYAGAALHASYSAAREYDEPLPGRYTAVGLVGSEQSTPEFASLPHFERPFAAEGTVWTDGPELALGPEDDNAYDDGAHDIDATRFDLHDVDQDDLADRAEDERDNKQPALAGVPTPAESTSDLAPQLDDLTALGHGGRWIALAAALAVLLLAAAGAITLSLWPNHASQSALKSTPSRTARSSNSAPLNAAATGRNQLIVDQAAATAPDSVAITATLNRYFNAINSHDYLMYRRTFVMALRGGISPASFSAGLGATTDSGEQLRSIAVLGGGRADAIVTFVTQQATARAPGSATCTSGSMEFVFTQRAGRYLLVAAPRWSEASNISCP